MGFQKPRKSHETYFSVVEQTQPRRSKSKSGQNRHCRNYSSRSSSYAQTGTTTRKRGKTPKSLKSKTCHKWPLISFVVLFVMIIGIIVATNTKAKRYNSLSPAIHTIIFVIDKRFISN